MTFKITTPGPGASGALPDATATVTRALLTCGVVAGPLFIVVVMIQALTRQGFDLTRHPISLLSLGDLGWIQIANFVVDGLLSVAFAAGMRRVLHPGRAGTWGPLLVGLYGAGLIAGGVFVTDPSLGFPPGAPTGLPTSYSWHALLHSIAPVLALNGMTIACFVFLRRFAALEQRGWATYCALTGAVTFALGAWPNQDAISVRLLITITLISVWASALAARLRSDHRHTGIDRPAQRAMTLVPPRQRIPGARAVTRRTRRRFARTARPR